MASSASDRINRATWSRRDALDDIAGLQTWTDVAERQQLVRLAPEVRNRPILDVGVGTGRTTSFLRLLSDDYVAVDYVPAMLERFRANHPGVEAHEADARDLSRFEDGRFALAVFSFNGIDAVDHEGRAQVLAELRRVVGSGGRVLLSTHNQDGPAARRLPWRNRRSPGGPARRAIRFVVNLPAFVSEVRSWRALRRFEVRGGDWSLRVSPAHHFTILVHYTTLAGLLGELDDAGFVDVELYAREDGRRVEPGDDVAEVMWFQVVARVP